MNTDLHDLNLRRIHDRFIEVVAHSLDVHDQQQEGQLTHFDHKRWEKRYSGTPWDELPRGMIEYNKFRPIVDSIVCQLMTALNDDEWDKANASI